MKKILPALFGLCAALAAAQTATLTTDAIRVRDPYKTFEGRLRLALHQPNTGPLERLRLFGLTDDGTALRLESE